HDMDIFGTCGRSSFLHAFVASINTMSRALGSFVLAIVITTALSILALHFIGERSWAGSILHSLTLLTVVGAILSDAGAIFNLAVYWAVAVGLTMALISNSNTAEKEKVQVF